MKHTTTLYCLNNFNDITWWTAEYDEQTEQLLISWGRCLNNNITQKNAGGSQALPNSTLSEYQSRVDYQINRKGYSRDIPTSQPSLPMLAQEYKRNPRFNHTALQPKLDGIRCIMSRDGLLSRKNQLFTSCPHLELYLSKIPEGVKLDGELIIPNTPLQTIYSYVMRNTPDLVACQEIEYHVFDVIDTDAPFSERIYEAQRIVEIMEEFYIKARTDVNHPFQKVRYFSKKCPFKMVHTVLYEICPTDEELQDQFDEYKSAGYEGMMIRNANAPYEINKRSAGLLKMKAFVDSEFEIVDVIPGTNREGVFVCATSHGKEFKCSFKATRAKRQQILTYRENYIGKWLKVEFEGLTDSGIPRCPVGIHYFTKEESDKPVGPIDTGNLD
jgi:DNA ligase-1